MVHFAFSNPSYIYSNLCTIFVCTITIQFDFIIMIIHQFCALFFTFSLNLDIALPLFGFGLLSDKDDFSIEICISSIDFCFLFSSILSSLFLLNVGSDFSLLDVFSHGTSFLISLLCISIGNLGLVESAKISSKAFLSSFGYKFS